VKAGPDRGRPVEPEEPLQHVATAVALIVDPDAGGGRARREMAGIEDLLRQHSVSYRVLAADPATGPDALARRVVAEGERFVVAVGDDRTANAVLNGIIRDDRPGDPDVVLGLLAANTGADAIRTFGLSQDPAAAIDRLLSGPVYPIDIGKATVTSRGGALTRYFLNMAQVGLGGLVARRAARLPRGFGRSRQFLGYWLAMTSFRRPRIRMHGDRRDFEGAATNVVVANLQYTGNGVYLSPRSWPEDGYFDLQVYTGPRSDSFTLLPKMFIGEHLPHPNIVEYRSTRVRIEAERPTFVEVDGVPSGTTPVTFEVLPRVLKLKV
jgi:diacylglycerol kinase (ATP)